MQASDAMRREIAASYSVVIVREGGRSSIPEAAVIEPRGRGVLGSPAFAGDDDLFYRSGPRATKPRR